MGGHGALVLALRNRERYQSVSAFFAYFVAKPCALGGRKLFLLIWEKIVKNGQQYDAGSLIQQGYKVQGMRIDQGLEDEFLPTQLRTEDFY